MDASLPKKVPTASPARSLRHLALLCKPGTVAIAALSCAAGMATATGSLSRHPSLFPALATATAATAAALLLHTLFTDRCRPPHKAWRMDLAVALLGGKTVLNAGLFFFSLALVTSWLTLPPLVPLLLLAFLLCGCLLWGGGRRREGRCALLLFGAAPPLLGAAATGGLHAVTVVLWLFMLMWQALHLRIDRIAAREDAGLREPGEGPEDALRGEITIIAASLLPLPLLLASGRGGWGVGIAETAAGACFLAALVWWGRKGRHRYSRGASILYLIAVLGGVVTQALLR